jgi:uncharacterized MAPEG superfamily protein
MTVPVWVLLAFALWTLALLASTVGVHRWFAILTRRANFATWGEYHLEGPGWYKRAHRAHANCVENLPVYAALVLVAFVAGVDRPILDALAITLMGARVLHSVVHVAFEQTNGIAACRSGLFILQYNCMLAMAVVIMLETV